MHLHGTHWIVEVCVLMYRFTLGIEAASVEARNQDLCKIMYNFTIVMESEGTSIHLYSISGSIDVQYEHLACLQEECEQ